MAAMLPENDGSGSHAHRANDIITSIGVTQGDVPENHFGNDDASYRRYASSRSENPSTNSSTSGLTGSKSQSETGEAAATESTETEISNDDVLRNGLGLVLRQAGASDEAATPPPAAAAAAHNWQSNKHCVKSRLAYLYNTAALSDVTFIVGGSNLPMSSSASSLPPAERFAAHKFVLSMSSAVFDAMFNGQMAAQDDSAIEIPDIEPAAFRALLNYLYTDEIAVDSEHVMSLLYAAKKYAVPALERECVEFLKENVTSDNVLLLLMQARLFDEPSLADFCLDVIDKNTTEALSSDGFVDLDQETLCLVLKRDSLGVREGTLFSALVKWAEHECVRRQVEITAANMRLALGDAARLVRYPLMTVEEFAAQVAQTELLTDSELVELFMYFTLNPKPSISFSDQPRSCLTGKEQVVSRFCQVDHRWGYSGSSDRIKFLVSKKIFIAGYGVYGSIHGPAEYLATIELLSGDTQRVLASNDTSFTCDGSSATFRLMFKEPVEVLPCIHYIAAVTLKGPDSYYGSKGLRKVTHESATSGKVSFQFSYTAGNNNGTSVDDGQIPEIMFYT